MRWRRPGIATWILTWIQLGAGSSPALAAWPSDFESEHAKIVTADATPVEPGHFEIESGIEFARARHSLDSNGNKVRTGPLRQISGNLALAVGLLRDVDLSLGLPYVHVRDESGARTQSEDGMGDLGVSFRYRLVNDSDRQLEVAAMIEGEFPTGSTNGGLGPSSGYSSLGGRFAFSQDIASRFTFGADSGFALAVGRKRNTERGGVDINFAGGVHVTKWLQPVVELNYAHEFRSASGDSDRLAITAGFVMPFDRFRITTGISHVAYGRTTDRTTSGICVLTLGF